MISIFHKKEPRLKKAKFISLGNMAHNKQAKDLTSNPLSTLDK